MASSSNSSRRHGRHSPAAAGEEEASGLANAVGAVPFMLHVLLVLWIVWVLLPVTLTGFFLFCVVVGYLLQVETRAREIERSEIAFTERMKINTRRTFDEGETSRWLNEGIRSMWAVGMEKFASKHFFGPMAPFFLDKFKPWIVKEAKMDVSSLHLGSTPPVFNFIRALERPPDGDHVAYEAAMEFHSGDDMNAEMSVAIRGGATTTLYISRLHVEGKVKISAKFLKGWPVVGRVRLCFASTPQVTMSYKPLNRNFPDVSLIPVVANAVEKMLDNAMKDSIVQPNMLEVDMNALASILNPDSRPQESKSTLLVEILEATNLRVADRNGRSDPFVTIHFGGETRKTKVIKKKLNPKWTDEKHEFAIKNWGVPNFLTLHVQDWDRVRFRIPYELGILTVSLKELYQDGKRHEFGERYEIIESFEDFPLSQIRFAITVNHTLPFSTFEGPGASDAGFEAVTQEIKSDYVIYNSSIKVGDTAEMKRSKSDTNLEGAATKHKVGKAKGTSRAPVDPTGNRDRYNYNRNASFEAIKHRTLIDEAHVEIIHMPYGPRGAFTIRHPGPLTQDGQIPAAAAAAAGIADNAAVVAEDGAAGDAAAEGPAAAVEAPGRPSWLRYPFRGRRGKKTRKATGTSQESNVLTETMSEQSESRESIEVMSTDELRDLDRIEIYHGPVRMDRIDTRDDVVAPNEPPDMYTPTSLPPPASSTAIRMSNTEKSALAAPASSHVADDVASTFHASEPLRQVPTGAGTAGGRGVVGDEESAVAVQPASTSTSSLPQLHPRSPARKRRKVNVRKWYKKITSSLGSKDAREKQLTTSTSVMRGGAAANGVAHSSVLTNLNAQVDDDADQGYPDEDDGDYSDLGASTRTEPLIVESPLPGANTLSNNGSIPGSSSARGFDSHELLQLQLQPRNNLMQETPRSRAVGSQSDRSNWASKMKKLVRQPSRSLRFESVGWPAWRPKQQQKQKRQQQSPPPQAPSPAIESLNSITEVSTGAVNHVNGMSGREFCGDHSRTLHP